MGGIDKGEKNIMQNVGQQKMRTKKIAQLQVKHLNRQPPLNILGSPTSYLKPF